MNDLNRFVQNTNTIHQNLLNINELNHQQFKMLFDRVEALERHVQTLHEHITAEPPAPAVEPTGYEEWDSKDLLTSYTTRRVIDRGRLSPDDENMRREILLRMQYGGAK